MSKRVRLEGLSLGELLDLATVAGELYVNRLVEIAGSTDPTDRRVQELLDEMTADAKRQVEAVRLYASHVKLPSAWRLDPGERNRVLWKRFPSARKRFGEGRLNREQALYFAETLQEESYRFHRALAEEAPNFLTKSFFENQGERCACSVDHLRTVVL